MLCSCHALKFFSETVTFYNLQRTEIEMAREHFQRFRGQPVRQVREQRATLKPLALASEYAGANIAIDIAS